MARTYATFDPATKTAQVTLSGGNLVVTGSGTAWGTAISTIGKSSGKWYWEYTLTNFATSRFSAYGIDSTTPPGAVGYQDAGAYSSQGDNGHKYHAGSDGGAYGGTFAQGDVVGVALDMDGGTITLYKNGSSLGTMYSSLSGTFYAMVTCGDAGVVASTVNFGATAFAQSVPSGYNSGIYTEASGVDFGNNAMGSGGTPAYTNNGDVLFRTISSTTNDVSASTYNSVSMTQIGTAQNDVAAGRYISLWYVTGATQGTNSFGTTGGTSMDNRFLSAYGENTSTPFTGTSTNSGTSTSPSLPVTTTVNNAYVVGVLFNSNTISAGANTTLFSSTDYFGFVRSTSLVTPAGALTLNGTVTINEWTFKGFGLNPPVASVSNGNFLAFM